MFTSYLHILTDCWLVDVTFGLLKLFTLFTLSVFSYPADHIYGQAAHRAAGNIDSLEDFIAIENVYIQTSLVLQVFPRVVQSVV
jgi:hypothetical protein